MAAKTEKLPEGTDSVIDTLEEEEGGTVAKAKARIKEEAVTLKSQATGKARDYARDGKEKATGTIREISAAMDDAAQSVDQRLGEDYGEYARWAAGAISSFAEKIEAKDVDDLLDDAKALVRKSPVVAIGIAAVAGFAIARLVKSGLGDRDEA
ncbi:hypothetical protein [Parasphingopyxis marina]|uniref:DUF883 domain-containing protein n=1 Tax=Parasphingopyxis marina TaxID=2761622 RepID=A0A842HXD3_9SPHN|nr:hypothetical protein [Parasphingopyxis marina]MBC2777766.1 hypothetical protein [Parasphingopyxis marina]